MEPWVIATSLIFAYLLFTIVLGFVANRRMAVDLEDFLLYGRKAGFVVLYLTVVATYHSAFAFLGSGGFFYAHGIGFWEAGTWTVLVGAITYTLGVRIWALGKKFGYITPADMLADFYESELGQKVIERQPLILERSMMWSQQKVQERLPELMRRIDGAIRELRQQYPGESPAEG